MAVKSSTKRGRGRPPRISRQAILDAVLYHGSDPTLAAIADHLGVTPQALYHHIKSHSDLLEMLFKEVLNKVEVPDPTGREWSDYAVDLGLYMYKVYASVPGLAEFAQGTAWRAPIIYQRQDQLLRMAARAGFEPLKAFWATRAIADFVQGWVAREQRRQLDRNNSGLDEREVFANIPDEMRDKMTMTEEAFGLEAESTESRFEFTLRALITGLTQLSRDTEEQSSAIENHALHR